MVEAGQRSGAHLTEVQIVSIYIDATITILSGIKLEIVLKFRRKSPCFLHAKKEVIKMFYLNIRRGVLARSQRKRSQGPPFRAGERQPMHVEPPSKFVNLNEKC